MVLIAACILIAGSAQAAIIGSSVTGTAQFGVNPTNFFDPANGLVPAGPLNSTFGPTVTIATPAVEYGFLSTGGSISADFTATGLTLTESVLSGGFFFTQHYTFTDAAFSGLTLSKTSDTFNNGGVTASLSGSVLTVDWAGGNANAGDNFAAAFSLSAPAASVPLPSGAWPCLFATAALTGIGLRRRPA